MAKFTDRYFSFPIKVYDGFSLKKTMEQEENSDEPLDADWVAGTIRIHGKEFEEGNVFWHEGFSKTMTVAEVAKSGFDTTVIYAENCGEFTCTWRKGKFESELNDFMEKYTALSVEPKAPKLENY